MVTFFVVVVVTFFVVVVVTLLIQFGFIAHYHTKMNDLEKRNAEMQQEIEDLKQEITYYESTDMVVYTRYNCNRIWTYIFQADSKFIIWLWLGGRILF